MHSIIPTLTLQASTEASLRFPVTATSLLSHQLISPSGCQISPSTARLQWGESDVSSERPVLKSSIHNCDYGRSVSNGARMCLSSIRTGNLRTRSITPDVQSSASVGILDRSEPWEGNADHYCNRNPSTEVDMQNLMEEPPGEAPTEHAHAHPAEAFRQTSPSSKTLVPSSQVQNHAESSEDSRLGPATASPNPGQELHPVLASLAPDSFAAPSEPPSLLVFSGGTAFNGVVEDLKHFTTRVSHVLPVSDDGGSTAEIVRVLGGPAVGDIRSRCLRLSDESSEEALAVKRLLGHRLPMDSRGAKIEWYEIVEGEHELWQGVSDPYKDTIRAFLVHFHTQILRHSSERFSFQNGSIGNFFFAGARTFFRSMDAAIFTYSSISSIPKDSLVLPAVSTNDRLVLGAELQDGGIIRGQNMISHPSETELEQSGVRHVNKAAGACPPLPAPIKRVFYMSTEGTHLLQEVFPRVNPNVVKNLAQVGAIIYGMGSLYTSICPSLILRGVGEAIAARDCPKVFLLNGTHDRETAGMAASDFILAVCNALNRTHGEDRASRLYYLPPTYVTVFLVPEGGQIPVDIEKLHSIGITRVVTVPSDVVENGSVVFNSTKLIESLGNVIANTPPALGD